MFRSPYGGRYSTALTPESNLRRIDIVMRPETAPSKPRSASAAANATTAPALNTILAAGKQNDTLEIPYKRKAVDPVECIKAGWELIKRSTGCLLA